MKRTIAWLAVVLALLVAAYMLGPTKSYCQRASEDYCRRPGMTSEQTFEECTAEATRECEERAAEE